MIFRFRRLHKLDAITCSIVLHDIHVSDIGWKLAGSVFSPF